jgi:DNA anti-recombination protein RmuC
MKKTYEISTAAIDLAVKFLREHATQLVVLELDAAAEVVTSLVAQINEEVALQLPQTLEQQVAALTEALGCGPEDEAVGNKG